MDISLALGGGGARGFAHIGVLRALENEGFNIRAIAGTSAGGIIACMYASGIHPREMVEIGLNINQNKLYSFGTNSGPALMGLSNVTKILTNILGDRTFSNLDIPCAVTAVDIKKNIEVIINQGRLVDAILATIAVPGIFPPQIIGNSNLVDGGVLNPVPVTVARKLGKNLPVIAVVLSSPLSDIGGVTNIRLPIRAPAPLVSRLTHLRVAQALSIFIQSVDLGQRFITDLRLEVDKPELIIRPSVGRIGLLDKVNVDEVVRLGEVATMELIQDVNNSLPWLNRLKFRNIARKQKAPHR